VARKCLAELPCYRGARMENGLTIGLRWMRTAPLTQSARLQTDSVTNRIRLTTATSGES
jgi:hypothetical protein